MARPTLSNIKHATPMPSPRVKRAGTSASRLGAKRFQSGTLTAGLKSPRPAEPPPWTRSTPVKLKANTTVDDAIFIVVSACRDHWQANVAAAIDGRDAEGIHQVRVGLRRLRSALTTFKKFIPAAQRMALNEEAKWLLSQLGPARDLDVLIQELTVPFVDRLSEDSGLAQVMRSARLARTKAQIAAAKALQGARARRFAARLEVWLSGRGWRSGRATQHLVRDTLAADFAKRFLNRRLRNIRTDYDDIDDLSVEARHDLRIAVKKTRYSIEFFQDLLPAKRVERFTAIMKELQDSLGHLNDLDVAERTVAALVKDAESAPARRLLAGGGETIGLWHHKAAGDAEPETARLWRKLKKVPLF